MVTDCLPAWCLGYKGSIQEVNVSKAKVSHKSEVAGPFSRGDTIINKHLTFTCTLLNCYKKGLYLLVKSN